MLRKAKARPRPSVPALGLDVNISGPGRQEITSSHCIAASGIGTYTTHHHGVKSHTVGLDTRNFDSHHLS